MTSKNRPDVVNVGALGHRGDKGNADEFFLGAQLTARFRKRNHPTGSDYAGTTTIEVPAGDYTITELKGMLGRETQSLKINGIRFRGAGAGITNIIFSPTTAGALVFNDYWLNIAFEGMSFITTYSGATFMQSYTTHNAQKYIFTDISWTGPWLYVFDLQGNNNNSEFAFYSCSTSGMLDTGSFLFIGASGSDQFLNYWFYGFKHWSTGASIIDAQLGGHFHFYGVDVSDYCPTIVGTTPHYLFNLRGGSHAAGVQSLTVDSLRVEAKSAYAALLYSEWASGNIRIECDWSSQVGGYTYGDVIHLNPNSAGGPIVNIHDSNMAGGIKVQYGSNAYVSSPRFLVDNTIWHQKRSPSEVVSWDESAAGSNLTRPTVEFRGCKFDYNDYQGAGGITIGDALVPLRQAVMTAPRRSLKVGALFGNLRSSNTPAKINLPVGALITGLRVLSPAGVTAEADGGTWTLATTDGTPVTIAAATVAGALSAGYDVTTALAVPFLCSTTAKATVTLTATNVTTSSYYAMAFIEGYW